MILELFRFANQVIGLVIFKLIMASASSGNRYSLNKNKYLLPPEAGKLRELLDHYQNQDPRNTFLLSLALRTGGRATEILNLRKSDLNPFDQSVFIRGIKNSNDREIPVSSRFFQSLHLWSQTLETDRLFDVTYDRLYQIWCFYRPVMKKFHSLRHTFAIELYQKTRDLRLVQVALGHRNITNTMIYADYVYSQQELRKIILDEPLPKEKLSPVVSSGRKKSPDSSL